MTTEFDVKRAIRAAHNEASRGVKAGDGIFFDLFEEALKKRGVKREGFSRVAIRIGTGTKVHAATAEVFGMDGVSVKMPNGTGCYCGASTPRSAVRFVDEPVNCKRCLR